MSIDPEQLLKLAKQRQGPAGVTLGWPMVVSIVEELRELQRLRNTEPDAMRQQLAERVAELSEERDALAAHVERMVSLLDGVIESNLDAAPEWDAQVSQWLSDAPATSLVRRDARSAASELELFAAGIRAKNEEGATADLFGMARLLETRAGQLRQQAEEAES